jgi:tetratricopeptide (TPR) repeat protein
MLRVRSRALTALLTLGLVSTAAVPAFAGICFTSGKVYVQQKVWDKAATQLECARKQEPQNLQVYSLLGIARAELGQYAAAGAAFQMGIQAASAKKDEKKVADLRNNQMSYMSRLYNSGVKAMAAAGTVEVADDTEGGKRLFAAPAAPEVAIIDTTVYGRYEGTSKVEEAAYWFHLSTLMDPAAVDAYRNLSYVYEAMGHTDDAMAAAREGLRLAPNDEKLARNLRAAAVGRANRLFKAGKYEEAVVAYHNAIENDPTNKLTYEAQIAECYYRMATAMDEKDPKRVAALDSTVVAYRELLRDAPKDSASASMRETAYYNTSVIYANQTKYADAVKALDESTAEFPNNKDLLSLSGQTKFQAGDYNGAATVLKRALALDPKDAVVHQFLFLSLNKLNKQAESVAEYSIYKALSEGKPRTGPALKTWVDSADNRLGPKHQLKKTLTTEGGYPEEVRTFQDGEKSLESWFYWTKGKVITFMDGQVLSQATFPPSKS